MSSIISHVRKMILSLENELTRARNGQRLVVMRVIAIICLNTLESLHSWTNDLFLWFLSGMR